MEYSISSEMLYSWASLAFIVSGLFCGIIRWMHMCKPYNQQGDYFYPGRKQAAFFFSAVVLQFPYFLNTVDPAIWLYIRVFGILYYPVCFSLLLRRYFRKERLKHNNLNSLYFAIPFGVIIVMLLLILFGRGDMLISAGPWLLYALAVVSLIFTSSLFFIVKWLLEMIDKYHQDNYSNTEDFPYLFARNVIYLPFLWILMMWAIFLSDSRWVKFGLDIFFSIWMVLFLAMILHPQRQISDTAESKLNQLEDEVEKEIKDEMDKDAIRQQEEELAEEQQEVDEDVKQEVLSIILRKYKEPHLQKPEVLTLFSYGRKVEANRYIMQVGYYNMINMFRLEHARLYKEAHPLATQDEVARASGFSSRYTLYAARNTIMEIDRELVKDVHLN